jgi:hypothetical protein
MRSRSPRGSSTPTSRPTRQGVVSFPRLRGKVGMGVFAIFAIPLATLYVIEAFTFPNAIVRIVLRSLPVLPVAIWTLWYEKSRPFERQRPPMRVAGRILLLLLVMAFAVAILGVGLNWLYDPSRVI